MSIASTSVMQVIPRTRRGVELMLLVMAVGVSVAAYVNIGLTVQNRVPASTGYYAAGIGVLAVIAHIALRSRAPYADPVLLPCAVLLNGLGLAMIHRIDLGLAASARARGAEPSAAAAPQQITWTAVGVLLFLAVILIVRDHRRLQALTYTAGLVGLVLLVFEKDLGTSLLFFGLFLILLYVATERAGWLVIGGLLFAAGGWFAYATFGHVQVRVNTWLDPFNTIDQGSGQLVTALYGQAWGGVLGRGLGQGRPEITPVSRSDFIMSSFGEELGLTGVIAIVLIFTLIVERGLRTALGCRDIFGKLVAAGLAMSFAIQVFVVIGGVTGLIPLTGLTTPFMSLGGTSLVANWAIIALLLRISDQARRPQTPAAPVSDDTIAMAVQKQ